MNNDIKLKNLDQASTAYNVVTAENVNTIKYAVEKLEQLGLKNATGLTVDETIDRLRSIENLPFVLCCINTYYDSRKCQLMYELSKSAKTTYKVYTFSNFIELIERLVEQHVRKPEYNLLKLGIKNVIERNLLHTFLTEEGFIAKFDKAAPYISNAITVSSDGTFGVLPTASQYNGTAHVLYNDTPLSDLKKLTSQLHKLKEQMEMDGYKVSRDGGFLVFTEKETKERFSVSRVTLENMVTNLSDIVDVVTLKSGFKINLKKLTKLLNNPYLK